MQSVPQRYERSSCDLHKLRLFIQWRTSPATSDTGSLTQKSQSLTQYMLAFLDRKNVLTLRHEIMSYWLLLGLVFWWPLIYNSSFSSLDFLTSSCKNATNIFYLDQKNVWSLRNEGVG